MIVERRWIAVALNACFVHNTIQLITGNSNTNGLRGLVEHLARQLRRARQGPIRWTR